MTQPDLEKLAKDAAEKFAFTRIDSHKVGYTLAGIIKEALERATEGLRAELEWNYQDARNLWNVDDTSSHQHFIQVMQDGMNKVVELRAQLAATQQGLKNEERRVSGFIDDLSAASEDSRLLERDKERLLNVLEHCALPDGVRPEKQHEVAAMVVNQYRPAMAQQKGGG